MHFNLFFVMLNVCNVFIFLGDFKLSLVTIDVISFVCIPSICIGVLQGNDDGDDDDNDDDDGDDDDKDDGIGDLGQWPWCWWA